MTGLSVPQRQRRPHVHRDQRVPGRGQCRHRHERQEGQRQGQERSRRAFGEVGQPCLRQPGCQGEADDGGCEQHGRELARHQRGDAARAGAVELAHDDLARAAAHRVGRQRLDPERRQQQRDARTDRAGRFQAAHGGTLFLDEVGNLPLAHQGKLLTVLERREVTPLGADRDEPVDVRIVSATNLDERRLFDPACFRADLLYRLNTIVLRVPAVRERREDVLPRAHHYLAHYATQYGRPTRALSAAAVQALQDDAWHGNVRALRHACERAVILGGDARLDVADFQLGAGPGLPPPAPPGATRLDDLERGAVAEAMRAAQGNVSEAARRLGLSRAALYRRLDKHGL